MNLIKDGIIIEATEKAYEVIYKDKGYIPYNSEAVRIKSDDEFKIDDLTKAEIMERLDSKEIEYDPNALKKELFDLLGSD